jgi:hypothetical protein
MWLGYVIAGLLVLLFFLIAWAGTRKKKVFFARELFKAVTKKGVGEVFKEIDGNMTVTVGSKMNEDVEKD